MEGCENSDIYLAFRRQKSYETPTFNHHALLERKKNIG